MDLVLGYVPWFVGLLLLVSSISFILRFVIPAFSMGRSFKNTIAAIQSVKDETQGNLVALSGLEDRAITNPSLIHMWQEYRETLHPQYEENDTGERRVVRWRATTLAETFFSEMVLVDTPLKTEFYKHLPGILTGLGIIGTFSGLISGLSHFDISDPLQAQAQLKDLINAVGHAFLVSGVAISLAMLFTWIEKSLVTGLYRSVEKLQQLIDSLFVAGAGEEYLARLVKSNEEQETQALHIKDLLVKELEIILTKISQQQSETIGHAIAQSLGGPMLDIADAVKKVGSSQGEAVQDLLSDVLADFSSKIEGMFGDKLLGMTEGLQQTTDAIQKTADQLSQIASSMSQAGTETIERMGERLNEVLSSLDNRQDALNQRITEFVEAIKKQVEDSQESTAKAISQSVTTLGKQVSEVLSTIRSQAQAADQAQAERRRDFEANTNKVFGELSDQTKELLEQTVRTNEAIHDSIAKLSNVTIDAINGINSGAETLRQASERFAKAGDRVTETVNASAATITEIHQASSSIAQATAAAKTVLADYKQTSEVLAEMVSELKGITENAKREVGMTTEVVARLKSATDQLAVAQTQSENYLKGINEVLVGVHKDFAKNLKETLGESRRVFQGELESAVNIVSAAVKDLGDTLEEIPGRRPQ